MEVQEYQIGRELWFYQETGDRLYLVQRILNHALIASGLAAMPYMDCHLNISTSCKAIGDHERLCLGRLLLIDKHISQSRTLAMRIVVLEHNFVRRLASAYFVERIGLQMYRQV